MTQATLCCLFLIDQEGVKAPSRVLAPPGPRITHRLGSFHINPILADGRQGGGLLLMISLVDHAGREDQNEPTARNPFRTPEWDTASAAEFESLLAPAMSGATPLSISVP